MDNQRSLIAVLLITLIIFFIELFGGFMANSLALLSDAGHMLTDILALVLAILAVTFAALPATSKRTFGFYRLEIISALFNGSFLTLVAFFIFYESIVRLWQPEPIQSTAMLMVATVGFLANIGGAVILAGASRENLNVRGAFLHVISDAISSLGVVIGGILIHFFGWYYADPILGVIIGILILRGAFTLVMESVNVLMEAAPKGISALEVARTIKNVAGVEDIHDLHIWTISSGLNAISAHILINREWTDQAATVLAKIKTVLKEKYQIGHSTFQTECQACPDELVCRLEQADPSHWH